MSDLPNFIEQKPKKRASSRNKDEQEKEEGRFNESAKNLPGLQFKKCDPDNCSLGDHGEGEKARGGHKIAFMCFRVEEGEFPVDMKFGIWPPETTPVETCFTEYAYARLDSPFAPYMLCLLHAMDWGVQAVGSVGVLDSKSPASRDIYRQALEDPNYNNGAKCNLAFARTFDRVKKFFEQNQCMSYKTRVMVNRKPKTQLLPLFEFEEKYEDFGRWLHEADYYLPQYWPKVDSNVELENVPKLD